jgi:hypothetical protein
MLPSFEYRADTQLPDIDQAPPHHEPARSRSSRRIHANERPFVTRRCGNGTGDADIVRAQGRYSATGRRTGPSTSRTSTPGNTSKDSRGREAFRQAPPRQPDGRCGHRSRHSADTQHPELDQTPPRHEPARPDAPRRIHAVSRDWTRIVLTSSSSDSPNSSQNHLFSAPNRGTPSGCRSNDHAFSCGAGPSNRCIYHRPGPAPSAATCS